MKNKLKVAPERAIVTGGCRHYWVIESPAGRTSWGVCKYCGARREFNNYLPDLVLDGELENLNKHSRSPGFELDD